MDQQTYKQAGERLARWNRVMVLTHHRPDGDALGAVAATKRIIQGTGRTASGFVYEDVSPRYRFIDDVGHFEKWQPGPAAAIDEQFDGIVIVDTCSWSQLEPVADYLRASRLPKIILDHHATRDDLSVNNTDDFYAIDARAASACVLVFEWLQALGWSIDCGAAEAIFTGMAADTGWFRFSNTDGRTLRAAATLVESCSLRPDILFAKLNASHSPARLALMHYMLGTLEFHAGGQIALIQLTKEMFERSGASAGDAEELVNEPMATRSVIATVLLTDMGDGVVRLNFRSKSPELVGRDIDVAAVARTFGGGGHHRAAGARVAGSLSEVRPKVLAAMLSAVQV